MIICFENILLFGSNRVDLASHFKLFEYRHDAVGEKYSYLPIFYATNLIDNMTGLCVLFIRQDSFNPYNVATKTFSMF